MVAAAVWNGTAQQAADLSRAVEHNCECAALKRRCGAHEAMLDQRWLDYILFLRWLHLKEKEQCRLLLSGPSR